MSAVTYQWNRRKFGSLKEAKEAIWELILGAFIDANGPGRELILGSNDTRYEVKVIVRLVKQQPRMKYNLEEGSDA